MATERRKARQDGRDAAALGRLLDDNPYMNVRGDGYMAGYCHQTARHRAWRAGWKEETGKRPV